MHTISLSIYIYIYQVYYFFKSGLSTFLHVGLIMQNHACIVKMFPENAQKIIENLCFGLVCPLRALSLRLVPSSAQNVHCNWTHKNTFRSERSSSSQTVGKQRPKTFSAVGIFTWTSPFTPESRAVPQGTDLRGGH